MPSHLRPYIAEPSEAPEEPERLINYEPNAVYLMNPDGSRSRGRALARQAGELAANASFQEWAEQAAEAQAALDKETEAALAEQHAISIGIQLANAQIMHRDRDDAPAVIMQQQEEEEAAREEKPEPRRRRR